MTCPKKCDLQHNAPFTSIPGSHEENIPVADVHFLALSHLIAPNSRRAEEGGVCIDNGG